MIKKLTWLKKPYCFEIAIILILSFTPLLWYKPGSLALGHDMGFPLNPIENFKDRLFVWTERFAFGLDQSGEMGAVFTVHGLEALLSYIGLPLVVVQKTIFIFWLFAPAFAIYLLARYLFPQKEAWPFRLFATLFYMFNHFSLQGWFIAERTKFSALTALPLVILVLLKFYEEDWSVKKAALSTGLILAIFNAGGFMPLYGSLAVAFILCLLVFVASSREKRGWNEITRTFKLILATALTVTLLNAYWVIPQVSLFLGSYEATLQGMGGLASIQNWVDYISKNSSFTNLFRLQGIVDWYDSSSHPYANVFLDSQLFRLLTFAFPVLAFSSLLLPQDRKNRTRLFFLSLVALAGLFFAAGSHVPLGDIYLWLIQHVPGFAIFRTPFYKFGGLLWFSYSLLIGYFLWRAVSILGSRFKYLTLFLVLFLILLLNFPYFNGSFFWWNRPLTTMVQVPNYVFDFANWVNSEETKGFRILALPPLGKDFKADEYTWGYWSLSFLPSLLSKRPFIANLPSLSNEETILVEKFYDKLGAGDKDEALALFQKFNVKYLLLRKDAALDLKQDGVKTPVWWQERLEDIGWLEEYKVFGDWMVYRVKDAISLNGNVFLRSAGAGESPYYSVKQWFTTLYTIEIRGASTAFSLTLNQRFSPQWQARILTDGSYLGRPVSQDNHFKVDHYANGWFINQPGSYTIVIEYLPQRLYILGMFITTMTVLILVFLGTKKLLKPKEF